MNSLSVFADATLPVVLDPATELINQASAQGDLVALIVGLVALAVVSVLKVLGKQVPIVDQLINVGLTLFNKLRGVKPKVVPAKPEEQSGLAGVVDVKPEEKK